LDAENSRNEIGATQRAEGAMSATVLLAFLLTICGPAALGMKKTDRK